jgi:formiminotetrahydrofolate cyclodeaminase
MPKISEAEKQARRQAVENAIGTHAMEGIHLDAATRSLMERFVEGELNLQQFSAAMDKHAEETTAKRHQLAGAA